MRTRSAILGAAFAGGVLALSAPTLASAAGALITGDDIQDGSLRSVDIKNETIKAADINSNVLEDLASSGPDSVLKWTVDVPAGTGNFDVKSTKVIPGGVLLRPLSIAVTGNTSCPSNKEQGVNVYGGGHLFLSAGQYGSPWVYFADAEFYVESPSQGHLTYTCGGDLTLQHSAFTVTAVFALDRLDATPTETFN